MVSDHRSASHAGPRSQQEPQDEALPRWWPEGEEGRPTAPGWVRHPVAPSDRCGRAAPLLGSKAETLASLEGVLERGVILPQLCFSADGFARDEAGCLDLIGDHLGGGPFAIRASVSAGAVPDERIAAEIRRPGRLLSILGVPFSARAIGSAIEDIAADYEARGLDKPHDIPILVQPMLRDVTMSGVVLSRDGQLDSDYYVVDFDDESDCTGGVARGAPASTCYLDRRLEGKALGRFERLIGVMRELEALFGGAALDVEFAELPTGSIVVLQCRPLPLREPAGRGSTIGESPRTRLLHAQARVSDLAGSRTILSNAADFAPSALLGERPRPLAVSLWSAIFDEGGAIAAARASQGYFDIGDTRLLLMLGGAAYVDLRASLNSLVPATLPEAVRGRMVDAWLDDLERHPCIHDRFESELAQPHYVLGLERVLDALPGVSESDATRVADALRAQTRALFAGATEAIRSDLADCRGALRKSAKLATKLGRARASIAHRQLVLEFEALLESVTLKVARPLMRLDRLYRACDAMLDSIRRRRLIAPDWVDRFRAVPAGARALLRVDLVRLLDREIDSDVLMERHGAIRPSPFALGSPRLADCREEVVEELLDAVRPEANIRSGWPADLRKLDTELTAAGLDFDARTLFTTADKVASARAEAERILHVLLSDLLGLVDRIGDALGVDSDELEEIPVVEILALSERAPEAAADSIRAGARAARSEREANARRRLPPILVGVEELERVLVPDGQPYYAGDRPVSAVPIRITRQCQPSRIQLSGRLVVLEVADSSFAWILDQPIAGLITAWGGATSPLARRCAEARIPAAIGVGHEMHLLLQQTGLVTLDPVAGHVGCLG